MKIVTVCLGLAIATVSAVVLPSQGRPNLSGAWISVEPEPGNRELTIKQDEATLAVEGRPDVLSVSYALDGSETKVTAPDGKFAVARAAWKGSTLVVTIHDPETKQDVRRLTWALDGDGRLVIVTEFIDPAASVAGRKPQAPLKNVFKRR